jgi:DNA-binding NtrC family response regulator
MPRSGSAQHETILVVDDSLETLEIIRRNLEREGYAVHTVPGVEEALDILRDTAIDLVITDLRMPRIGGMELIRHVRENFKYTEVLVITGFPSVKSAVESIKLGAEEYLSKPFTEEELLAAVKTALQKLHNTRIARQRAAPSGNVFGIIGESKAMTQVFRVIEKIAPTQATVLITGESGTGKELVARAIHYRSGHPSAPFVAVNCAAIPHELLESELFGHVKGAYTGATDTRAGFFQTANGGTLFLDEISSMSLPMQAKLLRVLQEKEFYMVGDKKPIKVNLRIIAATNLDLPSLVKNEAFREDLFYRLNVVNIQLPPLREREDDIILLIRLFAEKYARETGRKEAPAFSRQALETLLHYHWPGNVRELQNMVYNLLIMTEGDEIGVADLPPALRYAPAHTPSLTKTLKELERDYIRQVLASVDGNKTEAARILGIDRKTLREKLKD